LVRPGGRLVYATCTFAPEEDEGVIWRFLRSRPDFELVQAPWYEGFQPGRPDWAEWPADPVAGDGGELQRAVRLWPHKLQGEGHFVAVMQRAGEAPPAEWKLAQPARLAASDRRALDDFWQRLIDLPLPERLLLRPRQSQDVEVLAPPVDAPDTAGLRTALSGWRLGTLRKSRFEPSHALAAALHAAQVQQRLDEPLGSELVARYMRGEALDAPGPDGWVLIAVEGFPVGWGKRAGGLIKNHYPKSLRWG
jgi:NOL1/NOP2/fmu family ribosome biogenesis protein